MGLADFDDLFGNNLFYMPAPGDKVHITGGSYPGPYIKTVGTTRSSAPTSPSLMRLARPLTVQAHQSFNVTMKYLEKPPPRWLRPSQHRAALRVASGSLRHALGSLSGIFRDGKEAEALWPAYRVAVRCATKEALWTKGDEKDRDLRAAVADAADIVRDAVAYVQRYAAMNPKNRKLSRKERRVVGAARRVQRAAAVWFEVWDRFGREVTKAEVCRRLGGPG